LVLAGGTNFLEQGVDPKGIVHGVVSSLRLQGRTMFMPWLAPLTSLLPLGREAEAFLDYCRKRFVTRSKDGSLSTNNDFMFHMVRVRYCLRRRSWRVLLIVGVSSPKLTKADDVGADLSETALASEASLIMAYVEFVALAGTGDDGRLSQLRFV
jgi:hypothetical protein